MALLWLLTCLMPASNILALTVDHGLREGSAREAGIVATWCREKNIRHQTLIWEGKKPVSGLQDAARRNRYKLLIRACETEQVKTLCTAHNLDDQAETVFARLARASGPAGLRGMDKATPVAAGAGASMLLVRPLLDLPRSRLRATAKAQSLPFSDDPSNEDGAFERVRRRAFLAAIDAQHLLEKKMLVHLAEKMRVTAEQQAHHLSAVMRKTGCYVHGSGALCLTASAFKALENAEKKILLARLVYAAGAGDYEPSQSSVAQAVDAVQRVAATTCGGALIRQVGENLYVMREPAALLGRRDQPGVAIYQRSVREKKILWDNRLIVTMPENTDLTGSARLVPLGDSAQGPEQLRLLASTMPALSLDGEIIAVPAYVKNMLHPAHAPWNGQTTTLDMNLLIKERLKRQVVRF